MHHTQAGCHHGLVHETEGFPADEVVAIVDHLEQTGTTYQVNGGWGVDAHVGHQTRPHQDLDVFLDGAVFHEFTGWLEERGYRVVGDWMPAALELAKDDWKVDVHPMVLDDEGNGHQSGENATYFVHPAAGRAIGTIGGRDVVVGSIEHLEHLHTGYAPRDVDLHDLIELQKVRQRRGPVQG